VRKTAQVVIGLVISLLALGLAFWGADLAQVVQALREANYFYVLPAVALAWLGLYARALSWRVILGGRVPYRRVFDALVQGYLLNNVLPFRLGEFARAYIVSRSRGPAGGPQRSASSLSATQALSSVIVERLIDLLMLIVLLAVFLPLVAGLPLARNFAIGSTIVGLAALATLVLMARYRQRVQALARTVLDRLRFSWLPSRWLHERLANFLDGLGVLQNPRRALLAAFWSSTAWLAAGLGAWLMLRAFVPDASWVMGFFVLTLLGLGVAVPSAPGSIGVFQAVAVLALSVFNVDHSRALSFGLVFHASQLGLTSVLGSLALAREGESLGELVRAAQSLWAGARNGRPSPADAPASNAEAMDAGPQAEHARVDQ
jgi:glycosyltransferase 2 family protein